MLSELSGCIEHFLYIPLAKKVKRPAPSQPGIRVDEKDILHPFIVIGKSRQYLFQAGHGAAVRELPGREHIPALTKRKPDQLPEGAPLIHCLRSNAQILGDLLRLEDASVLFDEAGLGV